MVIEIHPATYDALLVELAGWVLRGCAVWCALGIVTSVVEAASAGRVRATSWVATPPAVRRVVLAGLGLLLVGSAPGPVWASRGPLPVPVRPTGAAHAGSVHLTDQVTVHPGDTLWALAGTRLPRGADDGLVLEAVHRLYARNRTPRVTLPLGG